MNISDAGLKLIIDFEVGGGEEYYRKFLQSPTWPGEQSGVTIGIGYDLGYTTSQQFSEAWEELLPESDYLALTAALGVKANAARELLHASPTMRSIVVLWQKAVEVFQKNTLPMFYLRMLRIYPQAEDLPDEARDALISLVFNRGTALAGDRRSEMLGIQNAMRDRRFYDVPELIRSMKRLWPNTKGLQRRRDAEAALFEKALEPKRKR